MHKKINTGWHPGPETWGERFHRAYRRAKEAGRVKNYVDVLEQLRDAPTSVSSDASIIRLGRAEEPPASTDMRIFAALCLVVFGYDPAGWGLSSTGKRSDVVSTPEGIALVTMDDREVFKKLLPRGKTLADLETLPADETWGERLHRAYRRAKYDGQISNYRDVLARVGQIQPAAIGTIMQLERSSEAPRRQPSRVLAWLLLTTYGYDPRAWDITTENTPMLRVFDLEKARALLRDGAEQPKGDHNDQRGHGDD